MSKQLRNFVFTWNNPYGEKIGTLEAAHDKMVHLRELLPIQYIIYGVEKVKKVHRISRAISNFKSELPLTLSNGLLINSHIESRRGSQQQAIEYCRKEGDFHEWGSPKNQGDRTDLQSIKRALESNSSIKTLLDSDLEINSHGLRLAERLLRYTDTPRDYEPQVIWLWGRPVPARQEPP